MLENRTNLTAFRGAMVAVCLALIAACGPGTANPPAVTVAVAAVPVNLTATAGSAVVTLAWTASSGATSYNVKRATTSGGPYTQLASPASAGYTDSTVTNGTAYYYVVSALNTGGESANSAQASATPVAPSVPQAPANLTATSGNTQISLTWTGSSGATSYHVKRGTVNGGPYTQIAAPAAASYTDTSLTNGTIYYYVVSAINAVGESANSVQASAAPSGTVTAGTWVDVTPSNADIAHQLSCDNFGTQTVQLDPMHPSNLYAEFNCQGIWQSTDYGATWTGPINTGTNGATVSDCAGGITISPTSTASVPTVYESCIRGAAIGFWKSVDGGVNWTNYSIAPTPGRQDYNPPVVDPYDQNHLLMTGHEQNSVVQSIDGGQTWTTVTLNSGMIQGFGTGYIVFINTGNATTTRATWLWYAQLNGGAYGTWRTTDGAGSWVQVDKNEHPGGSFQIYQPDTSGVLFMAGSGSVFGSGVLRSTDYGQTWSHVGLNQSEDVVVGTSKYIYSGNGAAVGPGHTFDPSFELAAQPGTGTWTAPGTPTSLIQGPAQFAVVNDGTHTILVGAMWAAGLWRYIEP